MSDDESTYQISLNFAKFVCSLNKPTLYVAINLELQLTSQLFKHFSNWSLEGAAVFLCPVRTVTASGALIEKVR